MSFLKNWLDAPIKRISDWAWNNPLTTAALTTGTTIATGYAVSRTEFWAKYKKIIAIAGLASSGYLAYSKLGPLVTELRKIKVIWDELQSNASSETTRKEEDGKRALETARLRSLDQTLLAAQSLLKHEFATAQQLLDALFPLPSIRAELQKARQLNNRSDIALLFELKIACISRTLTAVYYVAIVQVLAHSQLVISARHMLDSTSGQANSPTASTQLEQKGNLAIPMLTDGGMDPLASPRATLSPDPDMASAATRAALSFSITYPGHSFVCTAQNVDSFNIRDNQAAPYSLEPVANFSDIAESKATTRGPFILSLARIVRACVANVLKSKSDSISQNTMTTSRFESILSDSNGMDWARELLTESEAKSIVDLCRKRIDRVLFGSLPSFLASAQIEANFENDATDFDSKSEMLSTALVYPSVVSDASLPATLRVLDVEDLVHVTEVPAYTLAKVKESSGSLDSEEVPCATKAKSEYAAILLESLYRLNAATQNNNRIPYIDSRLQSSLVHTASRLNNLTLVERYHLPVGLAAVCYGIPEFKVIRCIESDNSIDNTVLSHVLFPSALSRLVSFEVKRRKAMALTIHHEEESKNGRLVEVGGEASNESVTDTSRRNAATHGEIERRIRILSLYAEQLEETAMIVKSSTFKNTVASVLDDLFSGLYLDLSKMYPIPSGAIGGPTPGGHTQPALKVVTRIAAYFDDLFNLADMIPAIASDDIAHGSSGASFSLVAMCRAVYMPMNPDEERFGRRGASDKNKLFGSLGGVPGIPGLSGDGAPFGMAGLSELMGLGDMPPIDDVSEPHMAELMRIMQSSDGNFDADRLEQMVAALEDLERRASEEERKQQQPQERRAVPPTPFSQPPAGFQRLPSYKSPYGEMAEQLGGNSNSKN